MITYMSLTSWNNARAWPGDALLNTMQNVQVSDTTGAAQRAGRRLINHYNTKNTSDYG